MRVLLRRPSLLLLALAVAAGGAVASQAQARPMLSPEAEAVAKSFVLAFATNDRDKVETLLPKALQDRYGPSPFMRMPSLFKPRADSRAGAIEFSGGCREADLPDRGLIILRRMAEGKQTVWRVRQIYWYDELPRDAQIPEKSPTERDRKEEPRLRAAAMQFLHDWMARDFEKLDSEVFHWWEVDRRPPKWVKVNSVTLRQPTNSLGGLRVAFTAKLTVLRALPKSVDGTLWLVQEEGEWRVRPLTVAFSF